MQLLFYSRVDGGFFVDSRACKGKVKARHVAVQIKSLPAARLASAQGWSLQRSGPPRLLKTQKPPAAPS